MHVAKSLMSCLHAFAQARDMVEEAAAKQHPLTRVTAELAKGLQRQLVAADMNTVQQACQVGCDLLWGTWIPWILQVWQMGWGESPGMAITWWASEIGSGSIQRSTAQS